MKDAKQFLEQLLEEHPVIAQQAQTQLADVYAIWPQVLRALGLDTLAENSSVISLERKQLFLAVRHSVFLQELKLRQGQWSPALEASLREAGHPYPFVRKVSFRVQDVTK